MDVYETEEAKTARRGYIDITFQEGPLREVGPNGCQVEDVIDVLVERLRGFQEGQWRNRETALAITHLEEAGLWLLKRRISRVAQGVEGTFAAHRS